MTDYSRWTPDEKNAECARRCGWIGEHREYAGHVVWFSPQWRKTGETGASKPPDYCSSLDLCVRDLVPLLRQMEADVHIYFFFPTRFIPRVDIIRQDGTFESADNANPAAAFVDAFLQTTEG